MKKTIFSTIILLSFIFLNNNQVLAMNSSNQNHENTCPSTKALTKSEKLFLLKKHGKVKKNTENAITEVNNSQFLPMLTTMFGNFPEFQAQLTTMFVNCPEFQATLTTMLGNCPEFQATQTENSSQPNQQTTNNTPITDSHLEVLRNAIKLFICKKCGNLSKKESDARAHSNKNNCSKSLKFIDQITDKGYCSKDNEAYLCSICNHKLSGNHYISQHMIKRHLLKITRECPIPEDLASGEDNCKMLKISNLKTHKRSEIMCEKKLITKAPNGTYHSYKCNKCDTKQSSASRIFAHFSLKHKADLLKLLDEPTDTGTEKLQDTNNQARTSQNKNAPSILQSLSLQGDTLIPSNNSSEYNSSRKRQIEERLESSENNQNESEANKFPTSLEQKRARLDHYYL